MIFRGIGEYLNQNIFTSLPDHRHRVSLTYISCAYGEKHRTVFLPSPPLCLKMRRATLILESLHLYFYPMTVIVSAEPRRHILTHFV